MPGVRDIHTTLDSLLGTVGRVDERTVNILSRVEEQGQAVALMSHDVAEHSASIIDLMHRVHALETVQSQSEKARDQKFVMRAMLVSSAISPLIAVMLPLILTHH